MVDIKLVKEFKKLITLDSIKANPKLKNMKLIQRGQRLSIQPVTKTEWDEILKMENLNFFALIENIIGIISSIPLSRQKPSFPFIVFGKIL